MKDFYSNQLPQSTREGDLDSALNTLDEVSATIAKATEKTLVGVKKA